MKAIPALLLVSLGSYITVQPVSASSPQSGGILSSSPKASQAKVSILTPISMRLDGALIIEPSKTTLVDVTENKTAIPVAGTVNYDDANRTITFKPAKPLGYGRRYELRVPDQHNTVPSTLSFSTYLNPIIRKDYSLASSAHEEKLKYDKDGRLTEVVTLRRKSAKQKPAVDAVAVYEYNNQGKQTRVTHFSAKGPDGIWRTDDDLIDSYHTSSYDSEGRFTEGVSGYGAGLDKQWFTEDDEAQNYFAYRYDKWGNVIQEAVYLNTGADQLILTEDDPLTYYQTYTYDGSGKLTQSVRYNNAGKDGKWFTGDDNIATYTKAPTTDQTADAGAISYGAGGDRIWFTADDVIVGYRLSREITDDFSYTYGSNAGPDGRWFTEDDALSHYTLYRRDELGNQILFVNYTNPGPDEKWLTSDDIPDTYTTYIYNETGLLEKTVQYSGPGPNNKWFDDNDEILNYELFSLDKEGNRTQQIRYRDPGKDKNWFTKDDKVEFTFFYDPAM